MLREEVSAAAGQAASAPAELSLPRAWQPFTPRGVAGFALASSTRLFLVQIAVALLVSGCFGWFVANRWFPVVTSAIDRLPATGRIGDGRLHLDELQPRVLAESRFLAITVDMDHSGVVRPPSHIVAELGRNRVLFLSLFGEFALPYDRGLTVSFNQPELAPWWGAWAPPILAILVLSVAAALLIFWSLLSVLYSGPVCLLAFFANRDCRFAEGCRLAGAALLPGALLSGISAVLYGVGGINLLELLAIWAVHFPVAWIYIVSAVCFLPRAAGSGARANPFAT